MPKITINETDNPSESAYEVLKKTVVNNNKIEVPVRVNAIANKLGMNVLVLPLKDDMDGLIVKEESNTQFKIAVNAQLDQRAARFVIAKEIGSYVRNYQHIEDDVTIGEVLKAANACQCNDESTWCDEFAMNLIMPDSVLKTLWADNVAFENIASNLGVTFTDLARRLDAIGLY